MKLAAHLSNLTEKTYNNNDYMYIAGVYSSAPYFWCTWWFYESCNGVTSVKTESYQHITLYPDAIKHHGC